MSETHLKITITIDGRDYATRDDDQEAAALLRLAGRDPDLFDLTRINGQGEARTFRDQQIVNLHEGDEFTTMPQPIEITVNGQPKRVDSVEVTFEEAVALAFPDKVNDPNLTFVVLYRKAADPKEGTLPEGGKITVRKKGTIINVTFTNKS